MVKMLRGAVRLLRAGQSVLDRLDFMAEHMADQQTVGRQRTDLDVHMTRLNGLDGAVRDLERRDHDQLEELTKRIDELARKADRNAARLTSIESRLRAVAARSLRNKRSLEDLRRAVGGGAWRALRRLVR